MHRSPQAALATERPRTISRLYSIGETTTRITMRSMLSAGVGRAMVVASPPDKGARFGVGLSNEDTWIDPLRLTQMDAKVCCPGDAEGIGGDLNNFTDGFDLRGGARHFEAGGAVDPKLAAALTSKKLARDFELSKPQWERGR